MKTIAESLLNASNIDMLWKDVETVDRIEGGDLYEYGDGSKLIVKADTENDSFTIELVEA